LAKAKQSPTSSVNRSTNSAAANWDRLFGKSQSSRQVTGLLLIDTAQIKIGPQPRNEFAQSELDSLCNSIRELRAKGQGVEGTGILQPLVVNALPGEQFMLVAGERRLRAATMAGLAQVPAIVVPVQPDELLTTQLIENLQRSDLSPLEEAEAIGRLSTEKGLTIRSIADALGKDKGWVDNRARLRKAQEDVKQLVQTRHDSIPHALAIESIADKALRANLITLTLDGASANHIRKLIQEAQSNQGVKESSNTSAADPSIDVGPTLSFQNDSQSAAVTGSHAERMESNSPGPPTTSSADFDPVEKSLRPANAFVAEAARILQSATITAEYRAAVLKQLADLEKSIKQIRKAVAS
jgi:ParB family chromosome partitioning protein